MSREPTKAESTRGSPGDYRDINQLRAIRYPVRQEIMDAISATGPSTIPELAQILGVSAESLYFHVRALVAVGLLYQSGRKPTASRPAAVYDTVHAERRIVYDLEDPRKVGVYGEIAQAILRLFGRDALAALESGQIVPSGDHRNYWIGRHTGWLDDDEVAEVNAHLEALSRLFRNSQPGSGKQPHTVLFGLAPLMRRLVDEDQRS